MSEERTLAYRAYRAFIGFFFKRLYLRDLTYIGRENIPSNGASVMLVSDHQNTLIDALGLVYSMPDRMLHLVTRGDVFEFNPIIKRVFYGVGLLPSFRLRTEGESALKNNAITFKGVSDNLLAGHTIGIFPEAGNQNKHWLGQFSLGYLRMAFYAAEQTDFQKEIFIMPSCNHYDSYFGIKNSMLVKFGTPISLKPYYELYREHPRTAQRQVNAIVREQISSMMLNIEDLDNYSAIDYIRNSTFGDEWCTSKGMNPKRLEDKLQSDKELVSSLSCLDEGSKAGLFQRATVLESLEKEACIDSPITKSRPVVWSLVWRLFLLILLLPLAVVALWPCLPSWCIPEYFTKKIKDPMFEGSFFVGLNVMGLLPIIVLITLVVGWCLWGFLTALLWVVALPLLGLFGWRYYMLCKECVALFRWFGLPKAKRGEISSLREELHRELKQKLI